MIKGIITVAFSLAVNVSASAQLFQVPSRVTFSNINVNLEPGARDIVQTDVYALLANRTTINTRLDRAALYFPIIENILSEENVPNDFKYLVLQESGLTPDAVSTSNAVGFWQFKKETATDYGLRVDDEIDERKNIHASTRAAARYLKKNNTTLNNWVSTLYSYYLGLGGIRTLVPAEWNGAREITVDEKTDRYILRCLAHKLVYENELRGYRSAQTPFYEYKASGGKSFTQIADQLGVDEVELRRYNRWVGGSKIPQDRDYVMLVVVNNPSQPGVASTQAGPATVAQQSTTASRPTTTVVRRTKTKEPEFPVLRRITPTSRRQSNGPIFYEINGKDGILAQEGDTYEKIADRAGIRSSRFLTRNDMEESDAIQPGKVYYIQKKNKKAAVAYHTLQHGQTLWDVSQMYGIRLSFLLRKNRIKSESEAVQPGRVLWLQKTRPCKTAIEVVPLPDPEQPKEAEQPAIEVAGKPDTATTRQPEVAVNVPTTTTPPQRNSGRVVLVDENGQVVSGNPSGNPSTPANRPPVTTNPNPTTPNPRPATREPQVATTPRPAPSRNTYPVTPGEADAPAPTTPSRQPVTRTEGKGTYHVVEPGETFYGIARKYDLKPSDLRDLNGMTSYPVLKTGDRILVKGTPTTAARPTAKPAVTEEKIATRPAAAATSYHTVQPGETFFAVARKYNLTPEELRDINGLTEMPLVNVGDRFAVRSGVPRPSQPNQSGSLPANRSENSWTYHTVQSGETLFGIARKYKVSASNLRQWNNLSAEGAIQSGQRLKIKNK
ncbi:LysM peptidoglycan-binding domain-containing protein [Siphonobacter sp.]|uniref:LysM peptidoglycan-binding domain-containing protein n=1 Tax=Siphonobacter sp. TaxID=1869184 RepID=UPI003B3AB7AC